MKWRAIRWIVDFHTWVFDGQGEKELCVSSVSTSGAKLSGIHNLNRGQEISISCLTAKIPASVVWTAGEECGIQFERPISKKELSIIRKPGGSGTSVGVFRKPHSNAHGFRELS